MIGEGERRAQAEAIIRNAGLMDNVVFTGRVPQVDAPRYLAACDIFASPHVPNPTDTPFFGSPTKLFEYMAMGRGIVASDLDQIGKVLSHDKTAWLVKPGSVPDLAFGLERLLDDAALCQRLGTAARDEAVRRHTWRAHVARILNKLERELG
jgi:glycosyltransferase involved in cell wall biosynthesis